MRENDKSRHNWCGFYFHSLNRILSGTTEIERWIQESNTSRNDTSRFHRTQYSVTSHGRCTNITFWYDIQYYFIFSHITKVIPGLTIFVQNTGSIFNTQARAHNNCKLFQKWTYNNFAFCHHYIRMCLAQHVSVSIWPSSRHFLQIIMKLLEVYNRVNCIDHQYILNWTHIC
jgi:hypothetical protein